MSSTGAGSTAIWCNTTVPALCPVLAQSRCSINTGSMDDRSSAPWLKATVVSLTSGAASVGAAANAGWLPRKGWGAVFRKGCAEGGLPFSPPGPDLPGDVGHIFGWVTRVLGAPWGPGHRCPSLGRGIGGGDLWESVRRKWLLLLLPPSVPWKVPCGSFPRSSGTVGTVTSQSRCRWSSQSPVWLWNFSLRGTHSVQLSTFMVALKGHARHSGAGQGQDLGLQDPGHTFSCSQTLSAPGFLTFLGYIQIYSVMPSFSLVDVWHNTKQCLCVVVLVKFYILPVKNKSMQSGNVWLWFFYLDCGTKINSLLPPGGSWLPWWPRR